MARSLVTRALEQRVVAAIEAATDSVVNGQAPSFDAYREICGYMRGLSEAIKILDDIEAELLNERDRPSTGN